MNFLTEFLEVTSTLESPTSFLTWAAFVSISATLRDNVYIEYKRRLNRLYPNIYVMLIGDSGEVRKSNPLKIAKSLIKANGNTKIPAQGRASIEGIINELSKLIKDEKGNSLRDASGIIMSEEFGSLLVKNPDTTAILTDLYDYHQDWVYTLKNEDELRLKHVCLSLFCATNKAFLKKLFTEQDIFGGLVGRMIIIDESKPRLADSGMYENLDPEVENLWIHLQNHLKRISTLKREILIPEAARRFFDDWYKSKSYLEPNSRTGFDSRIPTHVLKLSIILAACEENFQGLIEERHMQDAISHILPLKATYRAIALVGGDTKSDIAATAKRILETVIAKNGNEIDKPELVRNLMAFTDLETIDKALATLEQANYLKLIGKNNISCYKLTDKGMHDIMKNMKTEGRA